VGKGPLREAIVFEAFHRDLPQCFDEMLEFDYQPRDRRMHPFNRPFTF
jgi:hypothetical protein